MTFVDQSQPPPEAEGAIARQKLLEGGFPANQVQQWQQDQSQKLLNGGFSSDDLAKYWGDATPDTTGLANHIAGNPSTVPEATNPIENFVAEWQQGYHGIVQTQGKPTVTPEQHPGLLDALAGSAGDLASNAEMYAIGGMVGGVAGGPSGAGAGAMGLTAAARDLLLDHYNSKGGPFTMQGFLSAAGQVGWDAAKAATVGAVGGKLGGAAEEAVAPIAGQAGGMVANAMGFSAGSTATSKAFGDDVNANDFINGAILGLGMSTAGHMAARGTPAQRFVPSPDGTQVIQNLQDIYSRNGMTPQEVMMAAAHDPRVREEVYASRTPEGELVTPALDAYANMLGKNRANEFGPAPKTPFEPLNLDLTPEVKPAAAAPDAPITYTPPGIWGPSTRAPTTATPDEFKNVVSGYENQLSKYQDILKDGTINSEPDSYYQNRYSTLGKTPLKKGETWQGRMQAHVDNLKSWLADNGNKLNPSPAPEGNAEPLPGQMKPEQVPQVYLDVFKQLEGSGDEAVSPAGAIGAYQIMPNTARQYGFDPALLKDPAYNERAARSVVADLANRFHDNLTDMAVAYNAGPAAANAWIKGGRDFGALPHETQNYLLKAEHIGAIDEGYTGKVQNGTEAVLGEDSGDSWAPPRQAPAEESIQPTEQVEGQEPSLEEAEASFRSKIVEAGAPSILDNITAKLNPKQLLRGFQGQLQGNRDLDNSKIYQGDRTKIGTEDALRSTYGSIGRAAMFYQDAPLRLTVDKNGVPYREVIKGGPTFQKAFKKVKDAGGSFDGFTFYRLAGRSQEVAQRNVITGFDPKESAVLTGAPGQAAKYEAAAQAMAEAKDMAVDYTKASGVFSAKGAEAMKTLGRMHIVIRKALQGDKYEPVNPGKAWGARQPVRKMKGGSANDQIVDPNMADLDNLNTMIAMADRNVAMQQVRSIVLDHNAKSDEPIDLTVKVPSSQIKVTEAMQAEAAKLGATDPEAQSQLASMISARELLKSLGNQPKGSGADFPIWDDGKLSIWHTDDPNLAEAFRLHQESGGGPNDPLSNILTMFAGMQRAGITTDLWFPLRSLFHGQFESAALAEGGQVVPFTDLVRGTISGFSKDGNWQKFIANGGGISSMTDVQRQVARAETAKMFAKGTDMSVANFIDVAKLPLKAVQTFAHLSHTASQVGFMIRNEQKGLSTQKATMLARKAYLDYAEKAISPSVNYLSRVLPFFSTGAKDWEQLVAAATTPGRRTTFLAHAAIALMLPSVINTLANRWQDKSIADPKDRSTNAHDWMDQYWVLPQINGARIRIKKPYVGGFFFGTVPEMLTNAAVDAFTKNYQQIGHDLNLGRLTTDFVNGTGLPDEVAFITPIIEQMTNHDFFTGGALVRDSLARKPGFMQYGPNTSQTSKAIARFLGPAGINANLNIAGINPAKTSPVVVDNYVQQLTGTVGNEFWRSIGDPSKLVPSQIRKLFDPTFGADQPPPQPADMPIVGSWAVRNWGAGKAIDDFYNYYDEASSVAQGLKDAKGDAAAQAGLKQSPFANPKLVEQFRKASEAMRKILGSVSAINTNTKLTDAEKLKFTDAQMNSYYMIAANMVSRVDNSSQQGGNTPRAISPLELTSPPQ